jgi:hypothetical protein
MADLLRSNVTVLDSWTEGGTNGKRYSTLRIQAAVTTAGSGATTEKIPASAFGMSSIVDTSEWVNSGNTAVISAAPNYAGTEILLSNGGTTAPTSASGTFRANITGITL